MVANVPIGAEEFLGGFTATEIIGGYIGVLLLPSITVGPVSAASDEVSIMLEVPVGAVVTQSVVAVTARPPGTTKVGDIAAVRPAVGDPASTVASSQLVLDFGTLRSVSQLEAPNGITKITPWVGTKFDGELALSPGSGSVASFTEVQTERLLVDLSTSTTPSSMATGGKVATSTPPADLELLVAGTRVWFRTGAVPVPTFTEDVDVTAALQAAVDAAAVVDDGTVSVPVVLRARVPGTIGLTPQPLRYLRTYTVSFPEPTLGVAFDEEGEQLVNLPISPPAGPTESLTIHRVVATVAPVDPGPERVLPAVGPTDSTEAQLRLDPDRRLVVRLPRAPLSRFERLVGVRLRLAPEAGGIEVGGALLTGTASVPGEPVPDATFTPVTVAQGPLGWVTLRLAQPVVLGKVVEPEPADHLWVSIGVPRGAALLALATPAGLAEDERAILRRVGANGITRPLSSPSRPRASLDETPLPVDVDTLALRLVGIPPAAAPVELVTTGLVAVDPLETAVEQTQGLGGSVVLTFDPPDAHTTPDPASPRRSTLNLSLTSTAATSVTVGPVVVAYTDASDS